MNRVFFSGTINSDIETVYTPKGEKILTFSLLVEDGRFSIDVMFKDSWSLFDSKTKKDCKAVVSGVLTKTRKGSQDIIKLQANKLFLMEE